MSIFSDARRWQKRFGLRGDARRSHRRYYFNSWRRPSLKFKFKR